MLGTALYYPHIDIHDIDWLRSAILFWDEIQTIVPTAIEQPYTQPDTRLCADEGYLRPLHCDLHEDVLSDLGSRVVRLMQDPEWTYSLRGGQDEAIGPALMHANKIRENLLDDAVLMHPNKMPLFLLAGLGGPASFEILSKRKVDPRLRRALEDLEDLYDDFLGPRFDHTRLSRELRKRDERYADGEWLLVDGRFAEIYMSALAALLAKQLDVSPLTNEKPSSGVNLRCLGDDIASSSPSAARGALISVVMEGLRIDPETPIQNVLEFRRKRENQLAELSGKFDELKRSIETSSEGADVEDNARRVFENEIRPGLGKLKKELKRNTIESSWSGIQTATTFTLPSSAICATLFNAPVALGVGAFITTAGVGVKSYLARSRARSASPYTYLLDVERKFALPRRSKTR